VPEIAHFETGHVFGGNGLITPRFTASAKRLAESNVERLHGLTAFATCRRHTSGIMTGNPGASTSSARTLLLVMVAKTNQERGGILALSGASSDLLHVYAQTHR